MAPAGPVRVREASAGDAPAIAEVHVASWQAAYDGLLPQAVLDGLSVAQRTRHWRRVLDASSEEEVVVVERDGRVVGFVEVGAAQGADAAPGTGQLRTIYVHPDLWGTGVGRRLHDAALDRLAGRGASRAVLWMLSTNERAAAFYARQGWERDGRIRVQQFGGAVVIDHRWARDVRAG